MGSLAVQLPSLVPVAQPGQPGTEQRDTRQQEGVKPKLSRPDAHIQAQTQAKPFGRQKCDDAEKSGDDRVRQPSRVEPYECGTKNDEEHFLDPRFFERMLLQV